MISVREPRWAIALDRAVYYMCNDFAGRWQQYNTMPVPPSACPSKCKPLSSLHLSNPTYRGIRHAITEASPAPQIPTVQARKPRMFDAGRKLWTGDTGQGLPEYALLLAAIVTLVVLVAELFSEDVRALVNGIGDYIGDNELTDKL